MLDGERSLVLKRLALKITFSKTKHDLGLHLIKEEFQSEDQVSTYASKEETSQEAEETEVDVASLK